MDKQTLHELEIRLSSNICFLENLLKRGENFVLNENTPDQLYLSDVISDLKDIDEELQDMEDKLSTPYTKIK